MSDALPLYRIETFQSFEKLFTLPFTRIGRDWFDVPVKTAPSFLLAVGSEHLWFCADVPEKPFCDSLPQGEFAEDLWKKDVAEVFICEDGSKRYQEINLSPTGAWWSCLFDNYRKESLENFTLSKEVLTWTETEQNRWRAALGLPLSLIWPKFSFSPSSRANVSFITGGTNRKFFSFAKIGVAKPDFHKAEKFPPISMTKA